MATHTLTDDIIATFDRAGIDLRGYGEVFFPTDTGKTQWAAPVSDLSDVGDREAWFKFGSEPWVCVGEVQSFTSQVEEDEIYLQTFSERDRRKISGLKSQEIAIDLIVDTKKQIDAIDGAYNFHAATSCRIGVKGGVIEVDLIIREIEFEISSKVTKCKLSTLVSGGAAKFTPVRN